jgi:uncharacterized damage-inducible protein DinB
MDRMRLVEWWDEAFNEGVWWAPWRDALADLTADEAAWQPAPNRHTIWDLVRHMTFWNEYFVYRNQGGTPYSQEAVDGKNWQPLEDASEDAWRAARDRFAASHAQVRAALADPSIPPPPKPQLDLRYLLMHNSYHIGQVMYIRALLGRQPLEF